MSLSDDYDDMLREQRDECNFRFGDEIVSTCAEFGHPQATTVHESNWSERERILRKRVDLMNQLLHRRENG